MPLNSNIVTRLANGVSTTAENKIFSSFPIPDPTKFHIYDQDFDQYVAGDWTVTETQAGATQALIAGDGGILSLVNSATISDINQIQKLPAAFLPSLTKQIFAKFRVSLDDATLSDFVIGLQLANVDGSALATATDGFFFRKAAASPILSFFVRKDNAAGSNSVSTGISMVNATFIDLGFYYDGAGRCYYSVNDTVLGYLDATVTYFPDVILAPIVSQKASSGVARTTNVDKIYVAQER